MSIIGIGVDIVNNNRLKKLIKNHNFLQIVFTNKEQANSKYLINVSLRFIKHNNI